MTFETKQIGKEPDAIAPDGSEVRVLCQVAAGGLAQFTLPSRSVSQAMAHRTVDEVWLFVSGTGRMWRQFGDRAETVEVGPGMSVTIPVGTHFQFCCDGDEPLTALGATMPPWPGEGEAFSADGIWQPTAEQRYR